ncbi:MAG: 30S ribosomal protein S15, partial [Verrucomicrobiota bacterium]|nr:30S ribosomal protein S15 [Verrucomicrobiota bacterium]
MEEKSKTIETYRRHDKDTGSADVQVAILTKK